MDTQNKAYKDILAHRRSCDKWGKGFCLACFGGGLTRFTEKYEEEERKEFKKECNIKLQIESATSQFIGFFHGKKGFDLLELISSMGLEETEWKIIMKKEVNMFSTNEIEEIEEYFKQKIKEKKP